MSLNIEKKRCIYVLNYTGVPHTCQHICGCYILSVITDILPPYQKRHFQTVSFYESFIPGLVSQLPSCSCVTISCCDFVLFMNMRCIASSNESNTNLMASNEMLFCHYWTWAGSVPGCVCVCVSVRVCLCVHSQCWV